MSDRSARASLGAPAIAEDEDRMRCYVLFAGSQHTPHGGLADLVGIFTSEPMARQAFRNLRLSQTSATSWAQLAVVEGDRGLRALSWFGIGATPARTPVTIPCPNKSNLYQTEGGAMQIATRQAPSPAGPEVEPTARRHPVKRIAVLLVGLVAVGVISMGVASNDGRTRPVGPTQATVAGRDAANDPVVPFSVYTSVVADGSSSPDR